MIYPDIQETTKSVYLSPYTYTAFLPCCREKHSYTEKRQKIYISRRKLYIMANISGADVFANDSGGKPPYMSRLRLLLWRANARK